MGRIEKILAYARQNGCSDVHLTGALPPVFRKNGSIFISNLPLPGSEMDGIIREMLTQDQEAQIAKRQDLDFCFTMGQGLRHRVNVYNQAKTLCAAIRVLNDTLPSFESLNLPPVIRSLAQKPNGLVLSTGPTGSGKSTTLAAMIDYINRSRRCHILTLEDPVEYIHNHKNSIVHQREIGEDTPSFAAALRSALREDPDVILVGEMRDLETISAAVTAAETGHLVLSTLHTTGAANTIDRIIDAFPDGGKAQIRTQLAGVLRGVVTQQLVPLASGNGRCAAFEILVATDAVSSLIRESRCFQINSILQTSAKDGMCSLNSDLARLTRAGTITMEQAMEKATNPGEYHRLVQGQVGTTVI